MSAFLLKALVVWASLLGPSCDTPGVDPSPTKKIVAGDPCIYPDDTYCCNLVGRSLYCPPVVGGGQSIWTRLNDDGCPCRGAYNCPLCDPEVVE